jgi:hypothetical protein
MKLLANELSSLPEFGGKIVFTGPASREASTL